jgi:chromosome segregation ATPase
MNKLLMRFVPLVLTVTFPMSLLAQENVASTAIVKPVNLQDALTVDQDILDLQAQNIAEEKQVKDLVGENSVLVAEAQDKKSLIQKDFRIFSDYEQFNALRETLDNYNRQLKDRDERLAKKDDEIQALRARIMGPVSAYGEGRGQNILDQSVDASFYVGEDKTPRLKDILRQRKALMGKQYDALIRKSNNLDQLKSELVKLKKQLVVANAKYDRVIKTKDRNKAVAVSQSGAEINESTQILKNIERELNEKNTRLAELEASLADKDKEIIALKAKIDEQKVELALKNESIDKLEKQLSSAKLDNVSVVQGEGVNLEEQKAELAKKEEVIADLKKQLALEIEHAGSIVVQGDGAKFAEQRDELIKKDQSIADLKDQLVSALGSKDILKAQIRLREELIARHRQRIDLLEQKSKILTSRMKTDEEMKEAEVMKSENKEYSQQIVQLKKDLVDRTAEKEDVYHLMDKFKDRLKESAVVTEDQAKTIASNREQIAKMEEDLRISKEDIQSKQQTINSIDQNIVGYKATIAELGQEIQAKDMSIAIVQSSSDEKTKVHEAVVEGLKAQIEAGMQDLALLKEKLRVAEAKLVQSDRSPEIVRLQSMLRASREEIFTITGLLKDKEVYISKLQEVIDEKGAVLAQKTGELDKFQASQAEFTTVNSLLKSKEEAIARLQKEIEKGVGELSRHNTDIDKVQTLYKEQVMDVNKIKDELQWKEKEIERLKMQLKEKGTKDEPVADKKSKDRTAELSSQLRIAQDNLQTAMRKNDSSKLKIALKDARLQITALKEELKQKGNEDIKSNPDFLAMADQVVSLKENIAQLIISISRLNEKNSDLEVQLKQAWSDLDDCKFTASGVQK